MIIRPQDNLRQTTQQFPTIGRKNMIICGPNVFREQKKYFDQSKFWFAVVSRSLQKRPKGCDILSSEPNACYNSTAYEHIAGHDRMMSMPISIYQRSTSTNHDTTTHSCAETKHRHPFLLRSMHAISLDSRLTFLRVCGSGDFSLNELQSLVHSREWSSRIGNVFVLGGAPVYDTLAASAIPSRCQPRALHPNSSPYPPPLVRSPPPPSMCQLPRVIATDEHVASCPRPPTTCPRPIRLAPTDHYSPACMPACTYASATTTSK